MSLLRRPNNKSTLKKPLGTLLRNMQICGTILMALTLSKDHVYILPFL